uniref:Uncharacterized protein n=1 Tax=Siphoviridae sp. ctKwY15 TaxID=2827843 RepID=A0A8S5SUU9_9CAUD|nr:MAG TPA: hypothetical protein [Siphoviridae sp. ctKwY15]
MAIFAVINIFKSSRNCAFISFKRANFVQI